MRHVGTRSEKLKELCSEAEQRYRTTVMNSRNSFLAQYARVDSPIRPEEFVPSLLSEDMATIRAFMATLAHEQDLLGRLREQALALLAALETSGRDLMPGLQEKLRILGGFTAPDSAQ
jgi:hypothetical protein